MKKIFLKKCTCFLLTAFFLLLPSCGREQSSLSDVRELAAVFPFKYGAIYSDEFEEEEEKYFSDEMKLLIFGANAEKYDYIVSVSGYFSRDRVSGEEVLVILLDDRSHRGEITSVLYRRAAKKQDIPTRVLCKGDAVYFICADNAAEIEEYIKTKI
ncbi:MAG: hypothetical protein J6C89_04760 [Clostridia bacterium]|nr:hypothetical protein [Clostridia bacterium]